MAINKKFIHFKTFANFNSQKLSANEQDTQYTLGIDGEIQNGSPTILYNSICYIKDVKKQWTHGSLYNCSDNVDFATDLTGVLEATPEEFIFRPSAGTKSIRDESAVIRRIKGNTSVWGQLADINASFTNSGNRYIITRNDDGSVTIKRDPTITDGYWCAYNMNRAYRYTSHKYMFYAEAEMANASSTDYGQIIVYHTASDTGNRTKFTSNGRHTFCCFAIPSTSSNTWQFAFYAYGVAELTIHNLQCFDLTQIFGAGNEPTTIEEFKKLYPESYYPYCEPEVRSMRTTGIETIGFNAFNGEYAEVLGGMEYYLFGDFTSIGFSDTIGGEITEITIPEDKIYVSSRKGYIYASGSDICIHLVHSGVNNGEYHDYWKSERMLPDIAKYFPDGMHGIGDVFDEINEENVVKRFGVADLGTLTWTSNGTSSSTGGLRRWTTSSIKSVFPTGTGNYEKSPNMVCLKYPTGSINSTYRGELSIACGGGGDIFLFDPEYTSNDDKAAFVASLQGVLLYYELAEPIVTPVTEPLQLDYKVADFGTEKMLSNLLSSPFRADIVYQFNAEGRIRDNSRNIERLENSTKEIANIANEAYELIDDKQAELISGVNIKTINGESILGEGDLQINTGEDNIQSDWNVTDTTSDAYIKNKPTIPKVDSTLSIISKNAISNNVVTNALNAKGTYSKPNDGIPKEDLSSEVQQSLEKANTAVQVQGSDEIWYTTSDNNVTYGDFDYNGEDYYVSNTYSNGLGIMKFKYPITYINNSAFENNSTLTSIILPEGVISIGNRSFSNTSLLEHVDLPQSCTTIGEYAFLDCIALKNIDLSSITVFGIHAFQHTGLRSVNFSHSVYDLPFGVFQNCTALENIVLPNHLEIIQGAAFSSTPISSIIIPKTVTNIGDQAFVNCPNLKEIYFQSEVRPEIGNTPFDDNISDRKIYVPVAALNTYKSSNTWWGKYFDDMLAYVDSNNLKTINGTSLIGTGDISINTSGTVDLSGYYTKIEIDNKGYLTSIPSEYVTETELSAKNYATTTALNNKQDKLVSGTSIKTINGTSLLGSGDLSITTGEENVQSDWLENTSTDAYIKNRTHYINGTKITSAGTYTVNGSQIYFDGNIYNLELGVKTTLKSGPYVYATLTTATSLKIEDASNYIASYPVIAITSIKKLDDVFISDNIVRNDSLKTINGESILGSGDIVINSTGTVTEDTVSGWGFTKNAGTITEIKANGTSISTDGVANIPSASIAGYGVTKLSSSTNSTSISLAATPSAVKVAYDLANGKQDKLTSGTNIMTARGQSILTSGDLFDPVIISTNVAGTQQTTVGKCYVYSVPQSTAKTFVLSVPNNIWNDSINIIIKTSASITFNSSNTLPILWANGTTPTFDSDKVYEISFRYTPMGWLGVAVAFHSA